ncbi:hypothetical protein HU200_031999 [Digitaria exilis]|uniref:Uncharacterized protein n=1 Tax=Digitaria exilis TaxID=1010633 RepID=A0A835BK31_9POAL|nr:hypothetical protein HU200_031999 [Digitaria exilis]
MPQAPPLLDYSSLSMTVAFKVNSRLHRILKTPPPDGATPSQTSYTLAPEKDQRGKKESEYYPASQSPSLPCRRRLQTLDLTIYICAMIVRLFSLSEQRPDGIAAGEASHPPFALCRKGKETEPGLVNQTGDSRAAPACSKLAISSGLRGGIALSASVTSPRSIKRGAKAKLDCGKKKKKTRTSQKRGGTMSSGGANTVPLLTPYKMGKFDLSHRYALFFGRANPNLLIPNQQMVCD